MHSNLYVETLVRAAHVLGGVDVLAYELGVTRQTLADFVARRREMPLSVFLRAVDIVIEEATRPAATLSAAPPPEQAKPT